MNILKNTLLVTMIAVGFALAGCGGGGRAAMEEEQPPPVMMPDPPPEVVGVNMSTEEFTPITTSVYRDSANSTTTPSAPGSASIKTIVRDGHGGIRVVYVVDGTEADVTFTPDDFNDSNSLYSIRAGGVFHGLINYRQFDSLDYLDVNGWLIGPEAGPDSHWGFAAHGVNTMPENMPVTGSATYIGLMRSDAWDNDNPSSSTGRTRIRSLDESMTLNVNFDDGELTGRIEAVHIEWPDAADYMRLADTNTIEISNGKISPNGFAADWMGVDTNPNSIPRETVRGFSGDMNGHFYGPAAEEIGGLMTGSRAVTASTPALTLVGAFGAKKAE